MKTEEKTVKDWLNTLKEPYKTKALNNTFKNEYYIKVQSLNTALLKAFDWEMSLEGYEYWKDLTQSLENIDVCSRLLSDK